MDASYVNNVPIGLQIALLPRSPHGFGWLRPAIGVVELSQSIIQVCFKYSMCFSFSHLVVNQFMFLVMCMYACMSFSLDDIHTCIKICVAYVCLDSSGVYSLLTSNPLALIIYHVDSQLYQYVFQNICRSCYF
jgi:hypothetical protein